MNKGAPQLRTGYMSLLSEPKRWVGTSQFALKAETGNWSYVDFIQEIDQLMDTVE